MTDYSQSSTPQYVTHTKCGGIVETARIQSDPVDPGAQDVALYVTCPVCDDLVEAGELDGGDEHYLVRKPDVE